MHKRQLGQSNLFVNEIGYGGMSLSIGEHRICENDAVKLLQRAVDECGVDFFDTADSYCHDETDKHHNEHLIAKALRGERRQRVVIATKGGFMRTDGRWFPNGHPEHLRKTCEESLIALETDRIDLYQFHRHDPNVPIEESVGALVDLQTEGKIRHLGVSNFSLAQLELARSITTITSLQNPLGFIFYNEERGALLDYCTRNNITWIAYAPVGGHRNAHRLNRYEDWLREHVHSSNASPYHLALAWLLHLSPVVIPIPATTKFEHLAENMRAAEITLTAEEVAAMRHPRSWMEDYMATRESNDLNAAITALQKGLTYEPDSPSEWYNLACVYALTDNIDLAFDALNQSITHGTRDIDMVSEDTDLESLRTDPRYQAALQRMRSES